jgi:hypothetical protein
MVHENEANHETHKTNNTLVELMDIILNANIYAVQFQKTGLPYTQIKLSLD